MTQASFNCIVCGEEFTEEELQSVILSKINTTRFKICQTCLELSNPEDDYNEAKKIINSYLTYIQEKRSLLEESNIIII